jgi:hypothetical protein
VTCTVAVEGEPKATPTGFERTTEKLSVAS